MTRTVEQVAVEIKNRLKPYCIKIEIAGSIRRKKENPHDIDFVIMPILRKDLFGEPVAGSYTVMEAVNKLIQDGIVGRAIKDGLRYKQFPLPIFDTRTTLDLFFADEQNFGLILAIRTGGKVFSRRMVTRQKFGGWLPDEYVIRDGHLWKNGKIVPVPDERKFFEDILGGWVEPPERI